MDMMKIIRGALTLFFLIGITSISCTRPVSPPTINPTGVMETSMAFVKTEIVETLTAAPTSTPTFSPATPTPFPATQTPSYDRHDPEAVVRAYFEAWEQEDGTTMNLLLGRKINAINGFESTKSIEILETQLVASPSEAQRVYRVLYDVQYTDPNMGNTQTQMMFFLTWDVNRDAWIITKYGYKVEY